MTERSVTHATFVVERTYPASPERVFAAWSDPAAKSRWFGSPEEIDSGNTSYSMDFRVGGRESMKGPGPDGGFTFDALYQDIVPNNRVVYTYDMTMGGQRISVSVGTLVVERASGGGTRLTYTEQGVFLDGLDQPQLREHGTGELLDALGTYLATTAA